MANPILVEVTRGTRVESVHRGSVAVVDADGRTVWSAGDIAEPVFPRSAIKVFQAIPLVETGTADAYGFGRAELSLACASHAGEPGHVARAADMLGRAGLAGETLECGCHWPFDLSVSLDLARAGGRPSQLHNNCSGKHAGFLCTAVHEGEDPKGYVSAEHPVQRRAKAVIEDLTGATIEADSCGTDGCSIPTYAAPLSSFAHGFAKLVAGKNVSADRAAAGRRLVEACMAEPWEMSGTGRACLALMQAAPGSVFAKTGAEGVFCGALPGLGLGFALKIDDGGTRAAEIATAATVARLLRAEGDARPETFGAMATRAVRNWEKVETGMIRSVGI